jgi:hypothetical protein
MRIYLYMLAGITSALIGWNLGQFFLTDLGLFKQFPEITLFPCIAISLSMGMAINEIFISNPTRPKLCFRILKIPLLISLGLGLIFGLLAGGISQILFLPQIRFPTPLIRILSWLLIGGSVGVAEGLTWWWHSMEAGDPKRFRHRFRTSVFGAGCASLAAALLFELIRIVVGDLPVAFKGAEDPIGFTILGCLLGVTFAVTNSPSYMAALRAGAGFEYTGPNYQDINPYRTVSSNPIPYINKSRINFVSDREAYQIEEGLSIQLPGAGTIRIGSALKNGNNKGGADICIPELPLHAADIVLKKREAELHPNAKFFYTIEVNGERLDSARLIRLKHNHILTFYTLDPGGNTDEKIYRFVYYNRFLDPQA